MQQKFCCNSEGMVREQRSNIECPVCFAWCEFTANPIAQLQRMAGLTGRISAWPI